MQIWILHHLQIIGEAARALSDEFRAAYPEVSWGRIIGARNILVHHYFGIDKDLIWQVVQSELPELGRKIAAILSRSA